MAVDSRSSSRCVVVVLLLLLLLFFLVVVLLLLAAARVVGCLPLGSDRTGHDRSVPITGLRYSELFETVGLKIAQLLVSSLAALTASIISIPMFLPFIVITIPIKDCSYKGKYPKSFLFTTRVSTSNHLDGSMYAPS